MKTKTEISAEKDGWFDELTDNPLAIGGLAAAITFGAPPALSQSDILEADAGRPIAVQTLNETELAELQSFQH